MTYSQISATACSRWPSLLSRSIGHRRLADAEVVEEFNEHIGLVFSGWVRGESCSEDNRILKGQ
ncbi:MAG: hypothetical protein JWN69_63 [Alphaproteobacteria bacterium]|nr:hypothetical protein [Alphaproteobacteria bacterium]